MPWACTRIIVDYRTRRALGAAAPCAYVAKGPGPRRPDAFAAVERRGIPLATSSPVRSLKRDRTARLPARDSGIRRGEIIDPSE